VPADEVTVRMPGVGGTGVVTISQIVGMAALLDGKHSWGLDQTGLSQKGGPVVSDLRISSRPVEGSNKASAGAVDLLLGLDLLGATASENLASAEPARTVAVVSTSAVPTGEMVIDPNVEFPELSASLDALEAVTRKQDNFYLDAQALADALFGDNMPANAIVLGAAYQRGALPLSGAALEQAFRLNGAAVEKNLAAFAWGRACVVAPDAVRAITNPPDSEPRELGRRERALVERVGAGGELRRLLEVRVPDLIGYQSARYAERYVRFAQTVREREAERMPGRTEIAEAVARNLYKLMAYKDEYEVARLHLDAADRARVGAQFGAGAKVHWHLHPPLLRALGLKRKLKLGPWFTPAFRLLRRLKFLRATRLDPFGYAHVRQVERRLIVEYRLAVEAALEHLTPESYDAVLELCELPDMIRGYEQVKLEAVERYWQELERLRVAFAEDRPAIRI
jgi:indolepyruvate ferredoxin oxidoreductase